MKRIAALYDIHGNLPALEAVLSEIERAFQIGFIIFLPFLIIDLVVAAILMVQLREKQMAL